MNAEGNGKVSGDMRAAAAARMCTFQSSSSLTRSKCGSRCRMRCMMAWFSRAMRSYSCLRTCEIARDRTGQVARDIARGRSHVRGRTRESEVPREEVPREIRRQVRRERARTVMLSDVTRVAARSVLYAGSAFMIEYLAEREKHTRNRGAVRSADKQRSRGNHT